MHTSFHEYLYPQGLQTNAKCRTCVIRSRLDVNNWVTNIYFLVHSVLTKLVLVHLIQLTIIPLVLYGTARNLSCQKLHKAMEMNRVTLILLRHPPSKCIFVLHSHRLKIIGNTVYSVMFS